MFNNIVTGTRSPDDEVSVIIMQKANEITKTILNQFLRFQSEKQKAITKTIRFSVINAIFKES